MKVAATKQSEKNNYGRRGTYDYLKYGYVPLDYHESVNHTLDYAYSDFCISQVAKTLGDTETAEFYQKQSGNFANIFDTETKFMRAKDKEGNFRASFEDTRWGLDYCEGSAWQNSYAVYHNFGKLIELHGGKEAFANKLTNLANTPPTFGVDGYGFEIHEMSEMASIDFGQIAISNQPSFHIPYLFNYVGESSTSQVILKQLMTEQFNTSWNGFPGDEDNGSMASWFVFSSLGFYPVTPGAGEYVLGIPLFDSAVIHLENGKNVTINTKSNKPHLNFVKSVSLNNEDYSKVYFNHADLVKGAEIDFELAIAPSKKEVTKEDLPFSID
jgi:predicted alpha-1,2-mannosidase